MLVLIEMFVHVNTPLSTDTFIDILFRHRLLKFYLKLSILYL
jgi:hypothetical protein